MAVYNLQTGRNKTVQMLGLKELEQRVSALKTQMSTGAANEVMLDAAMALYDQAESNLRSVNAPHEVRNDLFVYGKNKSALLQATSEVAALVGLRKHGSRIKSEGYREWFPSRQTGAFPKDNRTRSKRGRIVLPGSTNSSGGLQKIGENLGTMWELGTTKMPARPWWRPAILSARSRIFERMAAGLSKIIQSS